MDIWYSESWSYLTPPGVVIFTFRTVVDAVNGNGARDIDVIASAKPWFMISVPKSIWLLCENFLSRMLGSCSWSELRAFPMPERDVISGPTVDSVFNGFGVEVYP